MGKFIDVIKRFFFASEKENKQQLILKSYTTQVIEYLEGNADIDNNQLCHSISEHFDYYSICELAIRLQENNHLENTYSFLREYKFSKVFINSKRDFEDVKQSCSKTEYLAFLIGVKKKLLSISDFINVKESIYDVDTEIIQTVAVLEQHLKEPITIRDAFGYFFIYEKKIAHNLFVNFLSICIKKNGGHPNIVMFLHTTVDDLMNKLDMYFIPVVNHLNFSSDSIYRFNPMVNIGLDEIREISKSKEYFLQSIPLEKIDEDELINVNTDCKDIEYIKFMLYQFFKFICQDEFYFEDKNVFDFFWSNCTEGPSRFSKLELNYAHSVLNRLVAQDRQCLNYIIAIFLYFKNGDLITKLPTKLPRLLSLYFGANSLKERTIYDMLTRETLSNKSFNKDNSYINDWASIKQKEYSKLLINNSVY
ncbi:hypothetical protein LNQ81_07670 [Myroides sp. M-43]|uniref:hypothetical protein n=1 Tax=Myroides oncorhynchi TaxID=2893756 RepID=UPI001E4485C2|nr:hypothetical protein [Myroides oncorhynchi]MCC9042566.1 hypothetical protein [Myroides oncorhynchi]